MHSDLPTSVLWGISVSIQSRSGSQMSRIRNDSFGTFRSAHVPEHDKMYAKPERQTDLRRLREVITEHLGGLRVLEIACGTGYWTQYVAEVAECVLAVDSNQDVLKIAKQRLRRFSNAALLLDDAFTLATIPDNFDAGFAAFWWSHVPREQLPTFLDTFQSKLHKGSTVIFTDNAFVAGSCSPISRTDEHGNTYYTRLLADATEIEVMKNYPTPEELKQHLGPRAKHIQMHHFEHYWCAAYQIA
jgi:SAM-dependent methyltransferase